MIGSYGEGGAGNIVSSVFNVVDSGLQIAANAQQLQAQRRQGMLNSQDAAAQERLLAQNIALQEASAAADIRKAQALAQLEAAKANTAGAGTTAWVQVAFILVAGALGYAYITADGK